MMARIVFDRVMCISAMSDVVVGVGVCLTVSVIDVLVFHASHCADGL